jgi:hypothetical protein
LIGSSVPDILALFTSGQKQNGFLFRSGYGQANFCTIKNEAGVSPQSFS